MRVELEDPERGAGTSDKGSSKGAVKGSGKGKGGGKCRLFFRNVLFETTAGYLMGLFKRFGYVVDLNLWKSPDGRSRGCGSVEYGSAAEARAAIQGLDGFEVDGRPMLVEEEDENRPGAGEKAIDNKGGDHKGGGHKGGGCKGQWKGDSGKSWGSGGKQQGPVKVFFKNLLFETPGGFMMKLFKTFGRVVEFDLWKGPDGRSKGMGTVEFASHAEAREAIQQLDGAEVDGRVIACSFDDPSRQESAKGSKGDSGDKGG